MAKPQPALVRSKRGALRPIVSLDELQNQKTSSILSLPAPTSCSTRAAEVPARNQSSNRGRARARDLAGLPRRNRTQVSLGNRNQGEY
jgi:hypothetical protein